MLYLDLQAELQKYRETVYFGLLFRLHIDYQDNM